MQKRIVDTLTRKQKLIEAIETLSVEAIDELTQFVAYLQYKATNPPNRQRDRPKIPIQPLNSDTAYEVWLPIDAPEAAITLMSLLCKSL